MREMAGLAFAVGKLTDAGVVVRQKDLKLAATGAPAAVEPMFWALHDCALLQALEFPSKEDFAKCVLCSRSRPMSDALAFVQHHLHACDYPQPALYSLPPDMSHESRDLPPGTSRALLLALGWVLGRSALLRRAPHTQPHWPLHTAGLPHNAQRRSAATARVRQEVVDSRKACAAALAGAASHGGSGSRPGAGERRLSPVQAIVRAGHLLLGIVGSLQLACRRAARCQLDLLRLFSALGSLGAACRLPRMPSDGGVTAGPLGWALYDLWLATDAGLATEDLGPARSPATKVGTSLGPEAAAPTAAGSGNQEAIRESGKKSSSALRAALARLRAECEDRVLEREFWRWMHTVVDKDDAAATAAPGLDHAAARDSGDGATMESVAENLEAEANAGWARAVDRVHAVLGSDLESPDPGSENLAPLAADEAVGVWERALTEAALDPSTWPSAHVRALDGGPGVATRLRALAMDDVDPNAPDAGSALRRVAKARQDEDLAQLHALLQMAAPDVIGWGL